MHEFRFDTDPSNSHTHRLVGYTDYMFGIGSLHFHFYCGTTSYLTHTHYFTGTTGLPIKTSRGHIHKMQGYVETNNYHKHKYSNFTFEDCAYNTDKISKVRESYI